MAAVAAGQITQRNDEILHANSEARAVKIQIESNLH